MSEAPPDTPVEAAHLACVLSFNATDPSGAGGITADALTAASAGVHLLPVTCAIWVRDTSAIHDHFPVDDEVIVDQARAALQDGSVACIKVGFLGNAENIAAVSGLLSDYGDLPVVAYMPDLSWMDDLSIDNYLDAFADLLLPQVSVLVGNHATLVRWLLPDWASAQPPGPRDLARAAAELGAAYTLMTGAQSADDHLENHLASPDTVVTSARFERFTAQFIGAGDTLSAALTALLGAGADLQTACNEALSYLDQALDGGFQPGMGRAIPDRLFWADGDDPADDDDSPLGPDALAEFPVDDTRH